MVASALLPEMTDDDVRAVMHQALDQELDRELGEGNWRLIRVSMEVGFEEVLTARTTTERIPEFCVRDRNGNALKFGETFAWIRCFPDEPGRKGELVVARLTGIGSQGDTVYGEVVLQNGEYPLHEKISAPRLSVVRW